MKKELKLNEVFPQWMDGGGIFSTGLHGKVFPWSDDVTVTELALDMDYHGGFSGDKTISPLIEKLLVNDILPELAVSAIGNIIYMRFNKNWQKLWDSMNGDYNPIENYSMTEHEGVGEVDQHIPIDYTEKETITNKVVDRDIYGFNSSNPTPSEKETENGEVKKEFTGVDKNQHDKERNLTRSGNIGVTTSQQMIESEIELRKKNFFELVYQDLDKVLTIPIYEIGG